MTFESMVGLTILVGGVFLYKANPAAFNAAVRYVAYSVAGFFVGFLIAFSVDNFAQAYTSSSLAVDGFTLAYNGPGWAVLWQSAPLFITSWIFQVVGVLAGLSAAYFFPRSFRLEDA